MCLIFFSLKNHPEYSLILAGNRDEFHNRPTAPAGFWTDAPQLLAGRDLEANGTWLGITKSGRISLLTNFRDPQNINPAAPSRGQLVSDYLEGDETPKDYMDKVAAKGRVYNGFNLIVGNPNELWYYSNYGNDPAQLSPGLHGLSNHLMDTPWPKVERGKALLGPLIREEIIDPVVLLDALYDDRTAADNQLPNTGVGLERERVLSSMFIKSPNYGSRCSTVVLIGQNGHVRFSERVYNLATFAHNTQHFEFDIEK